MTEGVMPVHVRIAVVLIIIASGIDAMAEAVAADIIVTIGKGIPAAAAVHYRGRAVCRRWCTVRRRRRSQVRHRNVIATEEAIAIGLTHGSRNMGMTIGVVIVCVRAPVSCEVAPRGFYPFVETTALYIVPCVVRPVPVTTILCEAGGDGRWRRCVNARCREQQERSTAAQGCDAKQVEIHLDKSPFHDRGELQFLGGLSNEC